LTLAGLPVWYMACMQDMMLPGSAVMLPALWQFFRNSRNIEAAENTVKRLFLLRNGDQVVAETADGLMHKLNIVLNTDHEIRTDKKDQLLFVMTNGGRDFRFTNKNAVSLNYDVVDRLMRGVPIDTVRSQQVFHHLIYKS
jgi:hypothetical protein